MRGCFRGNLFRPPLLLRAHVHRSAADLLCKGRCLDRNVTPVADRPSKTSRILAFLPNVRVLHLMTCHANRSLDRSCLRGIRPGEAARALVALTALTEDFGRDGAAHLSQKERYKGSRPAASRGSRREKRVNRKLHVVQGLPLPAAAHPLGLLRPGVDGRFALEGTAVGDADLAFAPARWPPILERLPWVGSKNGNWQAPTLNSTDSLLLPPKAPGKAVQFGVCIRELRRACAVLPHPILSGSQKQALPMTARLEPPGLV